jgi:hypothetical protein
VNTASAPAILTNFTPSTRSAGLPPSVTAPRLPAGICTVAVVLPGTVTSSAICPAPSSFQSLTNCPYRER